MPEISRAQHAQHGAEQLGLMREAARADAELDPRRPEPRIVGVRARLEYQGLARLELRQSPEQRSLWGSDQWGHPARWLPRGPHWQAAGGVAQLRQKVAIVVHLIGQNEQARGAALLTREAKGRRYEIVNRQL